MLYFYEIRNKLTGQQAHTCAKNFTTACKAMGWKPYHCRCIWKASDKAAY